MKTNYIHTNNNSNRIKPTRAGLVAQTIVNENPDFRFSDVRAVICTLIYKHPMLSDIGLRRKFYAKLMNEMFAA
jgi:hypothetical protein